MSRELSHEEHLAFMAEYMLKLDVMIEQHGFATQGVFPVEQGDFPFIYTVGFGISHDHPEIVITGMLEQGHVLLHVVKERLSEGVKFSDGEISDKVIQTREELTLNVKFRKVDENWQDFGMAIRYYGGTGRSFEMLQMLWPDSNGKFPDEEGYDSEQYPQHIFR